MLPCVCSVIDHRLHQTVVKTSSDTLSHHLVCHIYIFCFSFSSIFVLRLPPGWDASPTKGYLRVTSADLPVPILYIRVGRGSVRVKCLGQEHNTVLPGSNPDY